MREFPSLQKEGRPRPRRGRGGQECGNVSNPDHPDRALRVHPSFARRGIRFVPRATVRNSGTHKSEKRNVHYS